MNIQDKETTLKDILKFLDDNNITKTNMEDNKDKVEQYLKDRHLGISQYIPGVYKVVLFDNNDNKQGIGRLVYYNGKNGGWGFKTDEFSIEKKEEGTIKELSNEIEVVEVNKEIPDKLNKISKNDKDYEQFLTLYTPLINDKFKEEYGNMEDKELWNDLAKEMFLKSKYYILNGDEVKPEKVEESKRIEETKQEKLKYQGYIFIPVGNIKSNLNVNDYIRKNNILNKKFDTDDGSYNYDEFYKIMPPIDVFRMPELNNILVAPGSNFLFEFIGDDDTIVPVGEVPGDDELRTEDEMGYIGTRADKEIIYDLLNDDKDYMEISSKYGYRFNDYQLYNIATLYDKVDNTIKTKIEDVLDNINYHSECSDISANASAFKSGLFESKKTEAVNKEEIEKQIEKCRERQENYKTEWDEFIQEARESESIGDAWSWIESASGKGNYISDDLTEEDYEAFCEECEDLDDAISRAVSILQSQKSWLCNKEEEKIKELEKKLNQKDLDESDGINGIEYTIKFNTINIEDEREVDKLFKILGNAIKQGDVSGQIADHTGFKCIQFDSEEKLTESKKMTETTPRQDKLESTINEILSKLNFVTNLVQDMLLKNDSDKLKGFLNVLEDCSVNLSHGVSEALHSDRYNEGYVSIKTELYDPIESKLPDLARDVQEFLYDFDTYDYNDNYMNDEEAFEDVMQTLVSPTGRQQIKDRLKNVIEEDNIPEIKDKAQELINRINEFEKELEDYDNREIKTESQVSNYTIKELNKVINDKGNDFKLQVVGSEDKTNWLNIDKEDLKKIYRILQTKKIKKESLSYADDELMKKYNITKVYDSYKQLPYKVETYMFGSDGYTSIDHFNELKQQCEDLINFPVNKMSCYYNPWDKEGGDVSLTDVIYLNDIAEKYKIKTKIILVLEDEHCELVLDPEAYLGGKRITFYKPAYIVGRIEAGSDSVFTNSHRLNAYRKFSLNEKDQIEEWVKTENERIANNVDPDDDHNNLENQYAQARIDSMR